MLSKSTINRLTVQRGGSLDDIDWDKVNKCVDCPAVQECSGMMGKCPFNGGDANEITFSMEIN